MNMDLSNYKENSDVSNMALGGFLGVVYSHTHKGDLLFLIHSFLPHISGELVTWEQFKQFNSDYDQDTNSGKAVRDYTLMQKSLLLWFVTPFAHHLNLL